MAPHLFTMIEVWCDAQKGRGLFISLDGVVDTLLLGRTTYDSFAGAWAGPRGRGR